MSIGGTGAGGAPSLTRLGLQATGTQLPLAPYSPSPLVLPQFLTPVPVWELKLIRKLSHLCAICYKLPTVTPIALKRKHGLELVVSGMFPVSLINHAGVGPCPAPGAPMSPTYVGDTVLGQMRGVGARCGCLSGVGLRSSACICSLRTLRHCRTIPNPMQPSQGVSCLCLCLSGDIMGRADA